MSRWLCSRGPTAVGSSRYGNSAARDAASSVSMDWMLGVSEKRTDFGEAKAGVPRRDFFRNEEEATRGRSEARTKSSERLGSLGCRMLDDDVLVGKPWNCEVRSLYCAWRFCSISWSLLAALVGG